MRSKIEGERKTLANKKSRAKAGLNVRLVNKRKHFINNKNHWVNEPDKDLRYILRDMGIKVIK